jgi:hypothetical protein
MKPDGRGDDPTTGEVDAQQKAAFHAVPEAGAII